MATHYVHWVCADIQHIISLMLLPFPLPDRLDFSLIIPGGTILSSREGLREVERQVKCLQAYAQLLFQTETVHPLCLLAWLYGASIETSETFQVTSLVDNIFHLAGRPSFSFLRFLVSFGFVEKYTQGLEKMTQENHPIIEFHQRELSQMSDLHLLSDSMIICLLEQEKVVVRKFIPSRWASSNQPLNWDHLLHRGSLRLIRHQQIKINLYPILYNRYLFSPEVMEYFLTDCSSITQRDFLAFITSPQIRTNYPLTKLALSKMEDSDHHFPVEYYYEFILTWAKALSFAVKQDPNLLPLYCEYFVRCWPHLLHYLSSAQLVRLLVRTIHAMRAQKAFSLLYTHEGVYWGGAAPCSAVLTNQVEPLVFLYRHLFGLPYQPAQMHSVLALASPEVLALIRPDIDLALSQGKIRPTTWLKIHGLCQ